MPNIYYVAGDTGFDGNTGLSPEQAVKTLLRGLQLGQAGDIIYVKPGVYNETLTPFNFGSTAIRFVGDINGTVFGVPGEVIVDGGGVTECAVRADNPCGYYIFENFTFQNFKAGKYAVNNNDAIEADLLNIVPKMGGFLRLNNDNARLHFINCTIKNISDGSGSGAGGSKGGLVFHNGGHVIFQDCTIQDITTTGRGILVWFNAPADDQTQPRYKYHVEFVGCTITDNLDTKSTYLFHTGNRGKASTPNNAPAFGTLFIKDTNIVTGAAVFYHAGIGNYVVENSMVDAKTADAPILTTSASANYSSLSPSNYASPDFRAKSSQFFTTVTTTTNWAWLLDAGARAVFENCEILRRDTAYTDCQMFSLIAGSSVHFSGCVVQGRFSRQNYTDISAEDTVFFGSLGTVFDDSGAPYSALTLNRCIIAGHGSGSDDKTAVGGIRTASSSFTLLNNVTITNGGNTARLIYVNSTNGPHFQIRGLVTYGNASESRGGITDYNVTVYQALFNTTPDVGRAYDPVRNPCILLLERKAPVSGKASAKVPIWGSGLGRLRFLAEKGKTYTITMTVQKTWVGDGAAGSFVKVVSTDIIPNADEYRVNLSDTTNPQTITLVYRPTYSGYHDIEIFGSQDTTARPLGALTTGTGMKMDYIHIDDVNIVES